MSNLIFTPSPFFSSIQSSTGATTQLIEQIAFELGFHIRDPKKISAQSLLAALSELSMHGMASYNDVAAALNSQGADQPTKQAVALRMSTTFLMLCQKLLACAIAHKTAGGLTPNQSGFLSRYSRILVQDSTILKLPAWLFDAFSGVSNATSTVCNTRIQAVYDLLDMGFVDYSVNSYSENDLVAAPSLALKSGDLVLRDRGYLIADEFARHIAAGADCIYRHKTGTTYLDPKTLAPIDLIHLLQNNGSLDITVLLNNKQRTPVRLVAGPVNEETAALRRMKAKKETKGHNPSQAVLALMDWTIFITTIAAEVADFRLIMTLYGLRWRIEIIFKTWKSHLQFDAIHRVSETQLRILLCARLLVITALTGGLYKQCYEQVWRHQKRHLSLMKFINYIAKNPAQVLIICHAIEAAKTSDPTWKTLRKYCCYDLRTRQSFLDILVRLIAT